MGSLPDYVDMEVTATLKKQISDILVDNSDPENRIKFYDDWCDKYDEDLVVVGNYTGHTKCVEAFLQLELNRNIAVLDLACGTGLLGAEVTTMIDNSGAFNEIHDFFQYLVIGEG